MAGPCNGCVTFEEVALLGAEEGDDYVVPTARGGVDVSGRIWLGQYQDMVKVYDPAGSLIRTVGRRGEGPGEFFLPNHFIPLRDGGMLIADAAQGRLSRFSSDMTFLDSRHIPDGFEEIAALDEVRFVVSMLGPTPEGMLEPLHLVADGSILRSFGSPAEGVIDPRTMRRKITVDDGGHIYAVAPDEYRVGVWDDNGESVGVITGRPLQKPPEELRNTEPGSRIEGLAADGGRLWVLVHEVREDWRSNSEEIGSGPTRRFLPKDEDLANWFRARIDIFEAETGKLVASTHAPGLLAALIDHRTALENRLDEVGRPTIVVWRLHTGTSQKED